MESIIGRRKSLAVSGLASEDPHEDSSIVGYNAGGAPSRYGELVVLGLLPLEDTNDKGGDESMLLAVATDDEFTEETFDTGGVEGQSLLGFSALSISCESPR